MRKKIALIMLPFKQNSDSDKIRIKNNKHKIDIMWPAMTSGVMLPLINNLLYNASVYKKLHQNQFTNDCIRKNLIWTVEELT